MSNVSYPRFLSECIMRNHEHQAGLRGDDLWGVYLSWCVLRQVDPGTEGKFLAALDRLGYSSSGDNFWRGITMTGPAAVEYILSSQPSLV